MNQMKRKSSLTPRCQCQMDLRSLLNMVVGKSEETLGVHTCTSGGNNGELKAMQYNAQAIPRLRQKLCFQ